MTDRHATRGENGTVRKDEICDTHRIAADATFDSLRNWVEVSGQVFDDTGGSAGHKVDLHSSWGPDASTTTGSLGSFAAVLTGGATCIGRHVVIHVGGRQYERVVR